MLDQAQCIGWLEFDMKTVAFSHFKFKVLSSANGYVDCAMLMSLLENAIFLFILRDNNHVTCPLGL